MSETDWSQASQPIPPFGFHHNDAAVNMARTEDSRTKKPNTQPLKAKSLKTKTTETNAIEAGTLETLRSLSQPSSALTTAIDDSDQPDSAKHTVITPTSERFSKALETKHENAAAPTLAKQTPAEPMPAEPMPAEPMPSEPTLDSTAEPQVTEPQVTEPQVTEPQVTEPQVTEPQVTEPTATEPVTTPNALITPEEVSTHENEAFSIVKTLASPLTSQAPQAFESVLESSPGECAEFCVSDLES